MQSSNLSMDQKGPADLRMVLIDLVMYLGLNVKLVK